MSASKRDEKDEKQIYFLSLFSKISKANNSVSF